MSAYRENQREEEIEVTCTCGGRMEPDGESRRRCGLCGLQVRVLPAKKKRTALRLPRVQLRRLPLNSYWGMLVAFLTIPIIVLLSPLLIRKDKLHSGYHTEKKGPGTRTRAGAKTALRVCGSLATILAVTFGALAVTGNVPWWVGVIVVGSFVCPFLTIWSIVCAMHGLLRHPLISDSGDDEEGE